MRFALMAATAALLGSVGVANAADLSDHRGSLKDGPVADAPVNWTGFYAGIHAGVARGDFDVIDVDSYNGDTVSSGAPFGIDDKGFIGGVQLGYNYQIGALVLGVEGELGYMGINAEGQFPEFIGDPDRAGDSVAKYESDFYGTLAARLGFAYGNALIYAKGGAAFLNVDASFTDPNPTAVLLISGTSQSDTLAGWVVGGGIEYALSDGWSLKAEYLHFKFEDVTVKATDELDNTARFTFDGDVDTIKVGLNYKFGSREESLK